jgi:peroxiredoxin
MRRRILILPIAAAVITGLVIWRTNWQSTHRQDRPSAPPRETGPAPTFVLHDQTGAVVKFERYIGRTRLLVLFTGEDTELHENRLLSLVADQGASLAGEGIQVIVVTAATPFAVRDSQKRLGKHFPFPVLTDIDPKRPIPFPVHQQWARYDAQRQSPLRGLFLVGRSGLTTTSHGHPVPEPDPGATLRRLASREWPAP